jgi:hypothetical protein
MSPTSISPLRISSAGILPAFGFSRRRSGGSLDLYFPLGSLLIQQIPSFRAKRGIPLRHLGVPGSAHLPIGSWVFLSGTAIPGCALGLSLNKQSLSFRAKREIPLRSKRPASHTKFPVISVEVARLSLRHLPNPNASLKEVL